MANTIEYNNSIHFRVIEFKTESEGKMLKLSNASLYLSKQQIEKKVYKLVPKLLIETADELQNQIRGYYNSILTFQYIFSAPLSSLTDTKIKIETMIAKFKNISKNKKKIRLYVMCQDMYYELIQKTSAFYEKHKSTMDRHHLEAKQDKFDDTVYEFMIDMHEVLVLLTSYVKHSNKLNKMLSKKQKQQVTDINEFTNCNVNLKYSMHLVHGI